MRIRVTTHDEISPQARTYAEYRLFAALSQLYDMERVRYGRVALRRAKRKLGGDGVSCTLTVALDGAGPLRIRTMGNHAYAAINRAVERLEAMRTPAMGPADREMIFRDSCGCTNKLI
jgi:ribosome-associated translation inhibitor RaiA